MDKRRAIKWLEGFLTSRLDDDLVQDMCEDLNEEDPTQEVTPSDLEEVFAECEEKLIEMCLEWYNETAEEPQETETSEEAST